MITKKEYAAILARKELIEAPAQALLSKIKELDLTPVTDIIQLKNEFKTLLFSQLIAANKGLKMQYDLHKTDKAKIDLINKSVSIDGYNELIELESLLNDYLQITPMYLLKIPTDQFLIEYRGSVEEAFKDKVIDVTETKLYKQLKPVADIINNLFNSGTLNQYSFDNGFYQELSKFLTPNPYTKTIEVNESAIFSLLKN